MNRWDGLLRVALQVGRGINCAEFRAADAVVAGRCGQDFDLVVDRGDAFDRFHGFFGVGFQCGAHYLSHQRYVVAFDSVLKVVEDRVERLHHEDVTDFFLQLGVRLPLGRSGKGRSNGCGHEKSGDQRE